MSATLLEERRAAAPPEPPEPERAAWPEAVRTAAAGWLSVAAACWMAAGLFRGWEPRAVALAGATLGVAAVVVSERARHPAAVQLGALGVAALGGALMVLPATGGGADLPRLVGDALAAGGLAEPPVAFLPGWRFLLITTGAALGVAAPSLALSLGRPRLALAVPLPPLVLAAAVQQETGLGHATVSAALLFGALAVAYGGELGGEGGSRGFEARRLARGAVALLVLSAAVAGIGRARVLFPASERERVIPPQRPPAAPLLGDRVLFTVRSEGPGPFRLGVLDVYDGRAWLFPPFDTGRFVDVAGPIADPRIRVTPPRTETAAFTIDRLEGQALPGLAQPLVVRAPERVQYDPRTQTLRLPDARVRPGLAYTVEAPAPPDGAALSEAPEPPSWTQGFTAAPDPPDEVVRLLRDAPEGAWDRLQFVRARLYRKVSAAGAGQPRDVPPRRVAALLRGGEGTPWEITAAEALLARWAGLPARIGYGFYAGDRETGAPVATVRPRHGATWIEVYFEGHGWVPVVGVPPRARSTLSSEETNPSLQVRPTEELALVVHVPIRLRTVRLFYVVARYWAGVAAGLLAAAALAWWTFPGALKGLRTLRRRRWARSRGPRARIAVAYAAWRDLATDLGIGDARASPLRFLAAVDRDDEHDEIAWLVTRALWGDLVRDLRDADAEAAEELARSVARRVARAHPAWARLAAFASRASLRDPWTPEVPNLWRAREKRAIAGRAAALLLVLLSACGGGEAGSRSTGVLPPRVAPERVRGYDLRREPKAERAYRRAGEASLLREGRVYTIRRAGSIEGYLQAAAFEPEVNVEDRDVRAAVLGSIAAGRFALARLAEERVWVQDLPEQRMMVWFTPDGGSMFLLVARRAFAEAPEVFLDVVRYVKGDRGAARARLVRPYDPRRGGEA